MNKKTSVFAVAALAGAISQTAMAEAPSFNYVQFDYVVSGDSEISEGCSGLMNPDTNVGGKVTTLSEVSDDQKTTILYF